jgi:squalene-hopene/tetraprenyl-beta-curcumene cyclase
MRLVRKNPAIHIDTWMNRKGDGFMHSETERRDSGSNGIVVWRERLRELLAGAPGFGRLNSIGFPAIPKPTADPCSPYSENAPEMAEPAPDRVDRAVCRGASWLLQRQNADGYWVGELEADTTLESYFILFRAFFGKREDVRIPKYGKVIRSCMLPEGGWPIYANGPVEISVSVLSYFALKIAGVPADAPDMILARDAILRLGGATQANTYTKFHLAWFDQYDWEHVPAIPPEMMFIPSIAPINIYEMSSWSRAIFVALSVIYALKPVCPLPPECHIDELFVGGREHADLSMRPSKEAFSWKNFFLLTDRALKIAEKFPIGAARRAALKKAEKWMTERFEASGGLGAILPAMMNSVTALKVLGYKDDHPLMIEGMRELDALEIYDPEDDSIRIQPCHSPVWDTGLTTYALLQAGVDPNTEAIDRAAAWLLSKEVKRPGDWHVKNPAPPGGWFFEFANEFYPDVDDTIVVMMALRWAYPPGTRRDIDDAIARGLIWVRGMQNEDGGWASFDRDNDKAFLTKVPFADHNAMIDPTTADITSRTLEMLATIAPATYNPQHETVRRAIEFLKKDQCDDGSWFGRWGVNYLYGTPQVLRGLGLIGEDMSAPYIRKAVDWLKSVQQSDGGWGERCDTYDDPSRKGKGPATASQTAWALIGLLAAGEGRSNAVRRGMEYLLCHQTGDGTWEEEEWTGTGFPRVFYLKYHYYRQYWPLMALSQYRRFLLGLRP